MGRPYIDIPGFIVAAMQDAAEDQGVDVSVLYYEWLGERLQDEGYIPDGELPPLGLNDE
jgi:hypothetical protein